MQYESSDLSNRSGRPIDGNSKELRPQIYSKFWLRLLGIFGLDIPIPALISDRKNLTTNTTRNIQNQNSESPRFSTNFNGTFKSSKNYLIVPCFPSAIGTICVFVKVTIVVAGVCFLSLLSSSSSSSSSSFIFLNPPPNRGRFFLARSLWNQIRANFHAYWFDTCSIIFGSSLSSAFSNVITRGGRFSKSSKLNKINFINC